MPDARPKILVSGSFDLLHGGHVAFFETAATYGDLHVCVGRDANILALKGKPTRLTENERLYMVQAVRFVAHARLSGGIGMLDFEPDLRAIRPEAFVVNEDGHIEAKRLLCESLGVAYVVLTRVPKEGLPARSSSGLKREIAREGAKPRAADDTRATEPPYRICLAGGWMDQPFVSTHHAGSCVVFQIEPDRAFNDRSGFGTSTRKLWQTIYPSRLFERDPLALARLLFGWENPPGTKYVSGSQDAIGLTHPGINRLWYDGDYWPERIDACLDEDTCRWLERSIRVIELFERPPGYDPLATQNLSRDGVARLGDAGTRCWEAILKRDIAAMGRAITDTHRAWAELLPLTTSPAIDAEVARYAGVSHGAITSGCGGGYVLLATDDDVPNAFRVRVRR